MAVSGDENCVRTEDPDGYRETSSRIPVNIGMSNLPAPTSPAGIPNWDEGGLLVLKVFLHQTKLLPMADFVG